MALSDLVLKIKVSAHETWDTITGDIGACPGVGSGVCCYGEELLSHAEVCRGATGAHGYV